MPNQLKRTKASSPTLETPSLEEALEMPEFDALQILAASDQSMQEVLRVDDW